MKLSNDIHYTLRIETLSPFYIGDDQGKALSPYSDFFVDDEKNEVCYIDHSAVEKKLLTSGKIDQYVEGIRSNFDNNRSDFSLRKFLQTNLGLSEKDFVKRRISNHGLTVRMRQHLAVTAKTTGAAYIPGSSLKGAFRTAMLYDWYVSTKEGEKALRQVFRKIQRLEQLYRQIEDITRTIPNRRDQGHRIRMVKKDIWKVERDIFNEEELMGRSISDPDARRIRLSDTGSFSPDALGIYAANRIRLRPQSQRAKSQNKAKEIPQPREGVQQGFSVDATLSVIPPLKSKMLQYFIDGPEKISSILGQFAKDNIENELYLLEGAQGSEFKQAQDSLRDFYKGLRERVDRGEFLMRIGAGKTVFDNSLLLALIYGDDQQKEEETYFRQLRRHLFKVPNHVDLFPVTRTLAGEHYLPMGWVKIEIEKQ